MVVLGLLLIGGGVASAEIGVRHEELAVGVPVSIAAKGTAFTVKTLQFPEDEKVSLHFANDDVGIQHNVSIFTDETASTNLFRGTIVTGPASIPYAISPLKKGTYYFHCDVHPQQMNGTISVGGAPGEEPPPGPAPSSSSSPAPTTGPAATSVNVTAKTINFDVSTLVLKANTQVSITLDNQDAGVPHNLAIYTTENGTLIEKGVDPFPGIATKTWSFQAPKPGTYFFHCDIHFNMKGKVIFQ